MSSRSTQLLDAFLNPAHADLSAVATSAAVSKHQLAEWATAATTIEQLEKLVYVFELRLRLLAAQALPAGIEALRQVVKYTTPEDPAASIAERARYRETARRAAGQLIRLFARPLPRAAEPPPALIPTTQPPAPPPPSPLPLVPIDPFQPKRRTKPTHLNHILANTA